MRYKRVFLIVLDSLGVGELPDAELYNDKGSNTLKAISKSKEFNIPTLISLGLSNIDGINYLKKFTNPLATYGRFNEKSKGKDTTIGHFEIAGIISKTPFPTYPNGFPEEVIKEIENKTGIETLCNKPYSGTEVIKDYGKKHIDTGKIIVYTSADSVMQFAAHEKYFGLEKLYDYCRIARRIMQGKHAVGRIIARPFIGEEGNFVRTANRHDLAISPPKDTMLNYLKKSGYDVISIGKIYDIFNGSGLTESYPTKSNAEGMQKLEDISRRDFKGLCFANLVDFDMLYGHRNNIDGYANALSEFDKWLKDFLPNIRKGDLMIITADHGCDPSTKSTDHSREYVAGLFYAKDIKCSNLKTRESFSDIAKTIMNAFNIDNDLDGEAIVL